MTSFPFLPLSSPGHHSALSEQARLCHTPVLSLILWETTGDPGVEAGGETFLLHVGSASGQLPLVEPLGNPSMWGTLGLSVLPRHLGSLPLKDSSAEQSPSLFILGCVLLYGAESWEGSDAFMKPLQQGLRTVDVVAGDERIGLWQIVRALTV